MYSIDFKKEALFFLILFLGLLLILYAGWNHRALIDNIKYRYFGVSPIPASDACILDLGQTTLGVYEVADPSTELGTAGTSDGSDAAASSPNPPPSSLRTTPHRYRLVIPKIGVDVPVAFAANDSTEAVLKSLEEGVGLYPGSSMPGEALGRAVILGHSSRASWYNGEYATVFSLLARLEIFDEFYIYEDGKRHAYVVFSKQFLSPDAANAVLAGPAAPGEVNLITCWPIGSASERTLIRAKLIASEAL